METSTTIKKTYESRCPKGHIQYVVGRELTTIDVMCDCHKKQLTTK